MAEPKDKNVEPNRPLKSGQQIGAENVERLRSYLDDLRLKRGCLPSRNGKPDKSAIAIACGFDRQTFYNNPEAIALLETARDEFVVSEATASTGGRTIHLEQLVSSRDRRIQRLEEQLHSRIAEVEDGHRKIRELEERLRQYEILEEIMTTTGRKYRP